MAEAPVGVVEQPLDHSATPNKLSPEARRRAALRWREGLETIDRRIGPGTRTFMVLKRVFSGAYYDGSIHAGNLAYMAIIALFPFFITMAAVFSLIGTEQSQNAIHAFLTSVPPQVAEVIEPVAYKVITARSGWVLWAGGLVGLWTVSSLIETIRDILHRAYGTPATHAFWRYRLLSSGIIFVAVVLLLVSLFAQVVIGAAQEVIAAWFPYQLEDWAVTLTTSRLIPAAMLYLSIFMLFLSLTPSAYRGKHYRKWPGALLVTVWWVAVTAALPALLRSFFSYDLTYGSLAGVMIALFFFWLVGLGMVVGAELNAALSETPEERDMLGQADNRARHPAPSPADATEMKRNQR